MKIGVIGIGYVGLVSGICFSDFGHSIFLFDRDREKIDMVKKGVSPIFEPGLELLLERNLKAGRLFFPEDLSTLVKAVDVIFIAVGNVKYFMNIRNHLGYLIQMIHIYCFALEQVLEKHLIYLID